MRRRDDRVLRQLNTQIDRHKWYTAGIHSNVWGVTTWGTMSRKRQFAVCVDLLSAWSKRSNRRSRELAKIRFEIVQFTQLLLQRWGQMIISKYGSASNTKLFLPLIRLYSLPVHITFVISLPSSLHDPLGRRHWSLSFTHKLSWVSKSLTALFRYAAPHLWNKLPPLRVPCQSAPSECSPPSPGSDSAPKSVVGVSHGVFHSRLKTHLLSRSFPS